MLALIVALLGALIPTLFYVTLVWWIDRYEKEPVGLLFLAFAWGALPAAVLSILAEVLLDLPIRAIGGETLAANLVSSSIAAPLVEETCKGVALVFLVLVFRREFDDPLDGILYGAMIGFGFAFTEDVVSYFLPILSREGLGAGLINIFLRAVVFGINHAFWTGIIGAAVGYARLARDAALRFAVPAGGWMLAVVLHSIHNVGATLVQQTACLSLGISLVVDWGGIALLIALAVLLLGRERRWIEAGLAHELQAGSLSRPEFDLLRSARERTRVRWRARRAGGAQAYRLVGQYYESATELAFRRQQAQATGPSAGQTAEIERLERRLASLRSQAWPWLF